MPTNRSDKSVLPAQPNLLQEIINWLHRGTTTTAELCTHIVALDARVAELRVLIEARDQQNPPTIMSSENPLLVTIAEAARWLSCDKRTVRRLIEEGELEVVRRGRFVRVTTASIAAYIDRNKGRKEDSSG